MRKYGNGSESIWKLLGIVLLLMGIGQALSFPSFLSILYNYKFFSPGLLSVYAVALILAEISSGIGLIIPKIPDETRKYSAYTAFIVSIVWAFIGVIAFIGGLKIENVGYFGGVISIPFGWWVLLCNSIFVFLGYRIMRQVTKKKLSNAS